MAYVRLPLGIRVAMEFNLDGEPVLNIYHVLTPDPISTVKLTAIAQLFADWWTDSLKAMVSVDIALASVTAHNLDEVNGEKVHLPIIPNEAGTTASPSLPNNVALVVSHKTLSTGRSFQGRSYIAGITETDVLANAVSVVFAGEMVGVFLDLDDALAVANTSLAVASFISGGVPRAEAVGTIVNSFGVGLRVDSQRRRLP